MEPIVKPSRYFPGNIDVGVATTPNSSIFLPPMRRPEVSALRDELNRFLSDSDDAESS